LKILNIKKLIILNLALILFYPVIAKAFLPPQGTPCTSPGQPSGCTGSASDDKNKQKTKGIFNKVDWKDMSQESEKDSFASQDSSDDNDSSPTALSKYFYPSNDSIDNDSDDAFSSDSNPFGSSDSDSDSDDEFSNDQSVF
jgi:hypothetical protein